MINWSLEPTETLKLWMLLAFAVLMIPGIHRDVYKNASRNGCIWFDSDTRFDSKGEILSQNAVI